MLTSTAVPALIFVTLGIVLVAIAVHFFWHMRKPENRHPMEGIRERNREEMERSVPPRRE